jgi:hypothetical protein
VPPSRRRAGRARTLAGVARGRWPAPVRQCAPPFRSRLVRA